MTYILAITITTRPIFKPGLGPVCDVSARHCECIRTQLVRASDSNVFFYFTGKCQTPGLTVLIHGLLQPRSDGASAWWYNNICSTDVLFHSPASTSQTSASFLCAFTFSAFIMFSSLVPHQPLVRTNTIYNILYYHVHVHVRLLS